MVELSESYRCVEAIARNRARNFYYSFVVLPAEKRRALCAVYAFMRACDDVSDGEGNSLDRQRGLQQLRACLDRTLAGDFDANPMLPAFHDSVRRFSIPARYFHWIIDGAEMDLETASYQTFDELYRYCFHVASTVGLVCLHVFGFRSEAAPKHAEHCGIAFQLTNILRDIREDAQMGRVYLPKEDLDRFGYTTAELARGVVDERFLALMKFEADRASHYYDLGRGLMPLVDAESRPALWAMVEIYERILKKMVRKQFAVFQQRIRLSASEKAAVAARAFAMRLAHRPPA